MTPHETKKARVLLICLIGYFLIGYMGANWFNQTRDYYFEVMLPFETEIPFWPFFILGYSLVYLSLVLVYWGIDDYRYLQGAFKIFLVLITVHVILFILFPVKMELRPDLSEATGLWNQLTYFYYQIDQPANCFPSLHVSLPLLGGIVLWPHRRWLGIVILISAVIIAFSVVLVKQHYILDIVSAVAVTAVVYLISRRVWLERS